MPSYSPGAKPIPGAPKVQDSMVDPGTSPSLTEQVALGVGKARYQVPDSKHDYRNHRRSKGMPNAKVK